MMPARSSTSQAVIACILAASYTQGHIAEQKGGDRPLAMRPALLRPCPAAALDGGDNHGLAASSPSLGLIAVSVPAGFLPALALAADGRLVGLAPRAP
jgi:hypothetical protein